MFSWVLDALFGCWHHRYSFPMTVKKGPRSAASLPTGTYVVCLECGKEMPYDWQKMKIMRADEGALPRRALVTKEAL
jgi:hypothetical protein